MIGFMESQYKGSGGVIRTSNLPELKACALL